MATAYVDCQSCGSSCRIYTNKNRRDADRYAIWLEDQGYLCPDCEIKKREEKNAQAAEDNNKLGLPELTGTDKQIAWAESLRAERIEKIEAFFAIEYSELEGDEKQEYGYLLDAKEYIEQETSASTWIDNRYQTTGILLKTLGMRSKKKVERKVTDSSQMAILARQESTIQPKGRDEIISAEIIAVNHKLNVVYPQKNDGLRAVVKELNLRWSGECWTKNLTVTDEKPEDRIAEIGSRLLNIGIPVTIWDEIVREKAIKADYEPLHTRWITVNPESHKFQIQWAYEEDYYKLAKKITKSRYSKPFVVVPQEYYNEVQDFAERYDFKLSPGATKQIAIQEEARKKRLIAQPEQPKDIGYKEPQADFQLPSDQDNSIDPELLED